ncbi:MAG: hypothetical protein LC713_04795 [Actinobacteria bacterium]|nr:hypothetical protein [Actinomycetota bacterium]
MRKLAAVGMSAVCLVGGLTACDRDTVRVSFRPAVGASYRFEVSVHSVTTTRLASGEPERSVDDIVLHVDETVVSATGGEARVQVRLRQAGASDRTFVVRLDRAAQLAGVDAVDGLPPSVVGPDALPQILPGAPGAPPDRPLAPGERWTIDAPARLPGGGDSRLVGSGRLIELGLVDGRKVASTRALTRLPLTSTAAVRGNAVALDGTETTEGMATRDIADGAVERATTVTRGDFGLVVAPAGDDRGARVAGRLNIEVRSDTRRLR